MAVIEQILYGESQDFRTGGVVLGQSSGLSRGCVSEIVRLCDRWGAEKLVTLRRPVVMSFPLRTRLPSLPGRLFTIIQYTALPEPLFHAIVLTESAYAEFDYNPFVLVLEEVFIQEWKPEFRCERQQVDSDSLAPLVSQLPAEREIDMIDEAMRLLFAEQKLHLPLALNDVESDRFLALLIAALPRSFKRELRFASLAPSDDNQYNLAANFQLGGTFQNWYRILIASMSVPVSQDKASYLEGVKRCLIAGNFHNLEQLSRQDVTRDEKTKQLKRSQAEGPQPLPAERVVSEVASRAARPPRSPSRASAVSGALTAAVRSQPRSATQRRGDKRRSRELPAPQVRPSLRPAARRRSPRYRVRRGAGTRFAFVFLTSIALAAAGYWLSVGGWTRISDLLGASITLRGQATWNGDIDVAAVYESHLREVVKPGPGDSRKQQIKLSTQAMKEIRFGIAEDLDQQSRLMVDQVAQGINPSSPPNREIERMNSLAARSQDLEQELKRLLLSYFSFSTGVLWRDLSGLDDRELSARFDSLRKREPEALQLVTEDLGLTRQISEVRIARHQALSMANLVQIFEQKRVDPQWPDRAEQAAKAIDTSKLPLTLAAHRACALSLADLKRAENTTRFGDLAFERDFTGQTWIPRRVRDHLARLRSQVERYGPDQVPRLATATVECYESLLGRKLDLQRGSPEQLAQLLKRLGDNAAVRFDPENFGVHVDRLRFFALESLLDRQYEPTELPVEFFPDENRSAALTFRSLRGSRPSSDEWRDIADLASLPYYRRWAQAEARLASRDQEREMVEFDRRFQGLAAMVQNLNQKARQGQDWLTERDQLMAEISDLQARFTSRVSGDTQRRELLARLAELRTALDQPHDLALTSVTVRFAAGMLEQPTEVFLILTDGKGRPLQSTSAFLMGPAAPEGSGWVGSQPVAMDLNIGPDHSLRAEVKRVEDGTTLLKVDYGTAKDPLPRALAVTQTGEGAPGKGAARDGAGTVVFKMTDSFWRQLTLPGI